MASDLKIPFTRRITSTGSLSCMFEEYQFKISTFSSSFCRLSCIRLSVSKNYSALNMARSEWKDSLLHLSFRIITVLPTYFQQSRWLHWTGTLMKFGSLLSHTMESLLVSRSWECALWGFPLASGSADETVILWKVDLPDIRFVRDDNNMSTERC